MPKCISGLIFIASLLLSTHALAQTATVVHGPIKYVRTAGAPDSYRESFSASGSPGAVYKLIIENGSTGKDRPGSATFLLNGQEVIRLKHQELVQTNGIFEKPVSLLPENTIEVRLAGGSGGSITISIVCVSGCSPGGVKITSPSSGSLVNQSQVIIKGTISGMSGEIGVTIQTTNTGNVVTAPAEIQGTDFAGIAPLRTGDNTITVTAIDASGNGATGTVQVYTQRVENMVKLNIFPETGTAPLNVTLNTDSSLPAATNYAWDTNGDGTADQSGIGLASLSLPYDAPGLYFPSVTVTDGTGKTYTNTAIINVMDKTQLDVLLKAKWEGMKTDLASSNINGAITAFLPSTQERYREIFTALLPRLPEIARNMQDIQLITLQSDRAKYRIRKNEMYNEQAMNISYYIYFARDTEGRWRIEQF